MGDERMTAEEKDRKNHTFGDIEYFEKGSTSNLSPFPIEDMPHEIRPYICDVADSLQVSVDMVAVSVLGVIALCVQGSYSIQPKPDWEEPLNLYCLTTAKPSERKTPVIKEITRPIYAYMAMVNEKNSFRIEEYRMKKDVLVKKIESLKTQAAKSKGRNTTKNPITLADVTDAMRELSELEEVTPLRLIADDITMEALARVMQENNERMAIVTAEGGIFGMMAGRYNNQPNIDIILKAYSGETYISDRVTRNGGKLEHPLLTLVIMMQPKVLIDAMENKEFRDRGLLARFLYSLPASKAGSRIHESKKINPVLRTYYDNLIKELLSLTEFTPDNPVIALNDKAYEISKEFFYEIESKLLGEFEEIEDWAGKLHGNTMRIAGILHCIEHKGQAGNISVTETTMKQAVSIGHYFIDHAKAAFGMAGLTDSVKVKDAKYILKHIAERKILKIPKRDLYQICRGHFKAVEDMQPGLDELTERGYIWIDKQQTGGRPSEIITINPRFWGEKKEDKPKTPGCVVPEQEEPINDDGWMSVDELMEQLKKGVVEQ